MASQSLGVLAVVPRRNQEIDRRRAQNKAKVVPRGGVGVAFAKVILDQDTDVSPISCSAIQVSGFRHQLRPDMWGDIIKCKVPNSMVHGPTVQTLSFQGQTRLVVALPQPVTLTSQKWLTTIAKWKIVTQ